MFVDYEYYTSNFKGTALSEDEFNKQGNLACMYMAANTLSRLTDTSIRAFPELIQNNAKSCACALAEYFKKISDVESSGSGYGSSNGGIISSKTAGAVSVSYDTKTTAEYFINPINQEKQKQLILRLYLSPICIGGRMYNLLSKVI